MSTAAELAYFTDKKLMGFDDFGSRFLRYLQNDIRQSVKRLFIQGSFAEIMALSSGATDQVQIDLKAIAGDGFAHDGSGRLLDLEQIDRTAMFENLTGTTYEVGAGYVEYPEEIRINPNNGKPEYDHYVEGVGVEATPDSVTNNGTNLTFRVDSLFEQGVSAADHTGRIVRVFKKSPVSLLASEAIEEKVVFFGGGQNQITTTALFGQTTVSTVASDYVVQLVGIIVLKNTATNRPSLNPDTNFFAGTVDGNTGSSPVAFDISGQAVIQSQAAGSIVFIPYTGSAPVSWGIAATDVQSAIEEIVDDLTNNGSGTEGARLIALQSSGFAQTNPSGSLSWGGLGTSGDHVFGKLSDADRQIVRARFGMTHSANQSTIQADFAGVDDVETFGFQTHWLKGAGDLVFSSLTELDAANWPIVIGEGPGKTRLFAPAAAGSFNWRGTFKNMTIGATLAGVFGENGFFHAEQCVIAPRLFTLQGGEGVAGSTGYLSRSQSQSIRSCYFPNSVSGAGTPNSQNFESDNVSNSGVQLIENTVFESSTSLPCFVDGEHTVGGVDKLQRIFVNCAFIQRGTTSFAISIDAEDVHFVNCSFIITDSTNVNYPIFCGSNTEHVTFTQCMIASANGLLLDADASANIDSVTFRDCHFETGTAALDGKRPWRSENVSCYNCRFEIGRSSMSTTQQSASQWWIHSGGVVENCYFSFHGSPTWFGGNNWWSFEGGAKVKGNRFDFSTSLAPNADPAAANSMGIIVLTEGSTFDDNLISGTLKPSATASQNDLAILVVGGERCRARGNTFTVSSGNPATSVGWRAFIHISAKNCIVRDTVIDHASGSTQWPCVTKAYIWISNEDGDGSIVDGGSVDMDFHANSPAIDFFLNESNHVVFNGYNWKSNTSQPANVQFCSMAGGASGGKHCKVMNHNVTYDGATPTGQRFVYHATNGAKFNLITQNHFAQDSGAVNRSTGDWITVGADYAVVTENYLLNVQATVPTIPAGGTTGLVTANNVLLGSVAAADVQ